LSSSDFWIALKNKPRINGLLLIVPPKLYHRYPFLTRKERNIETGLDYFLARFRNDPHYGGGFGDSGFASHFQDSSNQVRHFTFYLGAGYGCQFSFRNDPFFALRIDPLNAKKSI
jgi:hypothetical protein